MNHQPRFARYKLIIIAFTLIALYIAAIVAMA
jgi:hypothetical protein